MESTSTEFSGAENEVKIINMNPGHFHAGLIHMHNYTQVDPVVHVYAPDGDEVDSYLSMVEQFNSRESNPTNWQPEVYRGDDYLSRMLDEKPGNVMVVAGNNARKIEYINNAVENGINVLSDKPMIIKPEQFSVLKETLENADEQGLLVNDMMTERHEITSILQKELAQKTELFGELNPGTAEEPAITKESVHFFYKTVAGETLIRPAWFFDVEQQGESIVDVSTHLVDLIMWQLFPEEPIDYENEDDGVEVVNARTWDTDLTQSQFEQITTEESFPDYLMQDVEDDVLTVTANGEFVFRVRGVYGKVSAQWGFTNPDGGDTHFSVLRGSLADLVIRQDIDQDFTATLYVEPTENADMDNFESTLNSVLEDLNESYPGLGYENTELGYKITIPDELSETHEEHFTRVTERYLDALVDGSLPEWERTNLLTKYYLTTRAYELSR
ncbi:putative oxidoreductase C-terminal domain-containing protein [Rhodohalobacter sp. SW132]|uniref:putative oxidoreductase C-terminal domain-containing protein n=1 Tax=Rhodohalobacter sp. SW132 TaxID=2293433 RepID=UPI0013155D89|nr:putative oxidoreductase C-terminal domain-containing protein [Rhodohalobacter sp. SW132]